MSLAAKIIVVDHRQVIRLQVDGGGTEHVGERSKGEDLTPAALKDDGSPCPDGTQTAGSAVLQPSSGRLPVALRWRDAVIVGHAHCAPGEHPLEAAKAPGVVAAQWLPSRLTSTDKERFFSIFCADWSNRHTVPKPAGSILRPYTFARKPYTFRTQTVHFPYRSVQIRTDPYNPTRVRETSRARRMRKRPGLGQGDGASGRGLRRARRTG